MTKVKGVLEHAQLRAHGFGSLSTEVVAGLTEHRKRARRYYLIIFAAAVLVLLLCCIGVVVFFKSPQHVAVLSGAMGVTVAGAIEIMRRVWREWSYSEILLLLLQDADAAQVADLIRRLIEKLD